MRSVYAGGVHAGINKFRDMVA